MAFIETTNPEDTTGATREMLERQQSRFGYVPNYAKVFTDRTDIMELWSDLQAGIRRHIDPRRFELVTFAAAHQMNSSYCSLAHGQVLQNKLLGEAEWQALVAGDDSAFCEAEVAMMELARKVVADSSAVSQQDIDRLRAAGLSDGEIFDVVATASARCFFAKLVDGLGAEPDASFLEMDEGVREKLCVGRPIATEGVTRFEA